MLFFHTGSSQPVTLGEPQISRMSSDEVANWVRARATGHSEAELELVYMAQLFECLYGGQVCRPHKEELSMIDKFAASFEVSEPAELPSAAAEAPSTDGIADAEEPTEPAEGEHCTEEEAAPTAVNQCYYTGPTADTDAAEAAAAEGDGNDKDQTTTQRKPGLPRKPSAFQLGEFPYDIATRIVTAFVCICILPLVQ